MTTAQVAEHERTFLVSTEIFEHPDLDIYTQMVCIVLRSYTTDTALPTLGEIARQGRMNAKQATRALQSLVNLKILSHKLFRQIVGEFGDDRLSWAAKGLLAFCTENPHIRLADLVELSGQSADDEHGVRRALKELARYGYLDDFAELKKAVS